MYENISVEVKGDPVTEPAECRWKHWHRGYLAWSVSPPGKPNP